MGYGIRHLDGSSDEDAGVASFDALYDELLQADGEHTDVAVIDDDTGWCLTAYPSGRVIFECLANDESYHMLNIKKSEVIHMWTQLASGLIDDILKLPWEAGLM